MNTLADNPQSDNVRHGSCRWLLRPNADGTGGRLEITNAAGKAQSYSFDLTEGGRTVMLVAEAVVDGKVVGHDFRRTYFVHLADGLCQRGGGGNCPDRERHGVAVCKHEGAARAALARLEEERKAAEPQCTTCRHARPGRPCTRTTCDPNF
jgi:hypothetical protein